MKMYIERVKKKRAILLPIIVVTRTMARDSAVIPVAKNTSTFIEGLSGNVNFPVAKDIICIIQVETPPKARE